MNWNQYDNIYILITHTHGDHSGGIGTMLQFVWLASYTDGMLPKCWIRRNDGVNLLKDGTRDTESTAFEPYSEYFISQLETALGIDHIEYDLDCYHERIVSSCKLITSKEVSMIPSVYYFKNCSELPEYHACADRLDVGDKLREMLVLDALTCNYDRHLNNIQFLVNSDTFEIIGLAPIFDNGMGLCSHCKDENVEAFIEYGNDHVPFAYYSFDDHIPQLMSKEMYNILDSIKDFCFINHKEYPFFDERMNALNGFIQHRIHKLLELYNE